MSFDAVAPWYRTLEAIAFGNDLQRCRTAFLNEIQPVRCALILGEGDGRFLSELLRAHPGLEVDCVDSSERMLGLARKRIENEFPDSVDRVRFLQRDIISWMPPENHYDLMVTNFFLDCFPEDQLASVIAKVAGSATSDATWLLADFCFPANRFARWRARLWLAAMYRFFRVTAGIDASELIDPSPFLRIEGFDLARQQLFRSGMLKSQIWRKNLVGI